MSKFSCIGACMLVMLASVSAVAGSLTVANYSMYNGAAATYTYWDSTYLPCTGGDCTTTGAFLSGGKGLLTDGTVPTLNWNNGGSAQWVGWYIGFTNENDPTITFNFASTVTVNSVTAWVDNTNGTGGVALPLSVCVDVTHCLTAPDAGSPSSGPTSYTISGLNISGSSFTVQFNQNPADGWVMAGEVQFQGTVGATVPEPATWALMVGGVAFALLRRRRSF